MRKNKFIINTANKLKKLAPVIAMVGMLNCATMATANTRGEVYSGQITETIESSEKKAVAAQNFNSLPEKWQRDLINILAKVIVAQEQGNENAYQEYKKEFETKFKDYVEEDQFLDKRSRKANIAGTNANYWRSIYFRYNGYMTCEIPIKGKRAVDKAYEESKKRFIETFGEYVGTDENGVDQHIRQDGGLKMNSEFNPEQQAAIVLNSAIAAERAKLKLQRQDQGREK